MEGVVVVGVVFMCGRGGHTCYKEPACQNHSQDAASKLMAGRVQLNIVLTLALCVSERGQERGGSSRKGGGGWEKRESDG
jgi:hypothetical protein